jgi:endogenous inhibitor of DNA gyrase (YacG/DUF329 family)
MKCPICKRKVVLGDPEFPFCSERCRDVDLGNWASEKYVIPGAPLPDNARESDDNDQQ